MFKTQLRETKHQQRSWLVQIFSANKTEEEKQVSELLQKDGVFVDTLAQNADLILNISQLLLRNFIYLLGYQAGLDHNILNEKLICFRKRVLTAINKHLDS